MREIIVYIRYCCRSFSGALLLLAIDMLSISSRLMVPVVFGFVVGEVAKTQRFTKTALLFVSFLLICRGVMIVLEFASECLGQKVFSRLELEMRRGFWDKLILLPQGRFLQVEEGVWAEKISGDVRRIVEGFRVCFRSIVSFLAFLFVSATIMIIERAYLVLAFAFSFIIFIFITRVMEPRITAYAKAMREAMYLKYTALLDNLALHLTLKVFGGMDRFTCQLKDKMAKATYAENDMMISYVRFKTSLMSVVVLVESCVLLSCLYYYWSGRLQIGSVVAIVMLTGQICMGLYELMQGYPQIATGKESFVSLQSLLDYDGGEEPLRLEPEVESDVLVSLESMSFGYGSKTLFHDVNLKVHKGEFVCIIGRNGAGKSTLGKLMMGVIEPICGRVMRCQIRQAEVPQRVVIFKDSIFENIRLGDSSVDKGHVIAILKMLGIDSGMDIDRVVSREVLSGGEGQLIGIARAMIRNPDFVVMDELCNNLDVVAKCLVADAIEKIRGKSTIVMITHDLDAAMSADSVYVIDDGKLVAARAEGNGSRIEEVKHILLKKRVGISGDGR